MTDLILKLLGARVEAAGDLASVRLAFQGGVGAGWVVLLALVLEQAKDLHRINYLLPLGLQIGLLVKDKLLQAEH